MKEAWTFVVICGISPLIATALLGALWRTPQIIMARDIAGMPVLAYVYVTLAPILLPATIFVCLIARSLSSRKIEPSRIKRILVVLGLLIGLAVPILLLVIGAFRSHTTGLLFSLEVIPKILVGGITGLLAAMLSSWVWVRNTG
jgi:hypothetical protein